MKAERWQQIERLYHAALERAPGSRAVFLDEACAGDAELRGEVESLLRYEARAARFIESPALEVAAGLMAENGTPTMSGRRISHYHIISSLGAGGMGEVYLAEDTTLRRKVALKLLPAFFTTDPDRLRRFAQEARAASALNHPNILTVHEIGEASTESGETHYIVTEYVAGETLRRRIASASGEGMKLAEAVEMAAQIAAALAAAHEAGITHRDIKPENVMVRPDGIVKVLDFGLAKLTETPALPVDSQLSTVVKQSTEAGMVMGTPGYMSPEQARGERVDARTDIFSLGAMLYEMVAGRAPFAGATTSETIAALLRDEPPPLTGAPPALARIVSRALHKDRTERYHSAGDLLDDLNHLKQELIVEKLAVMPSGKTSRRRTLPPEGATTSMATNRRRLFVALIGIILMTASAAAWFYFNRQPALTEKDSILLADFENKTGDAIFDGTLKQGLAIELQQSPFLNIFPEARVQQALRLMNRPAESRVTREVAREICERQGIKALIAGSIAPLGGHYVITLEAINAQNGEMLAHQQAQVESREQVLQVLSQAATRLREKLGESLSSIQFIQPLDQIKTSNLQALKDATKGRELSSQGRFVEAIPFLKRAVEIDPQFSVAIIRLALQYNVTGQPDSAAKYAEQSFLLQDRVIEEEKLDRTCWYHLLVTGNQNKGLEALTLQKAACDPRGR